MHWNERELFFVQLICCFHIISVYNVANLLCFSNESVLEIGQIKQSLSNQASYLKCDRRGGHCVQQLTVFPQLSYIKNVVMWVNDRGLAKNEATFLKGPCLFQTIIENNVKIVVCHGHGLTLWGQGQTLSFYFNFHMINYTPKVGWEACFTSFVRCTTLISWANLIKPHWESGCEGEWNEMYICNTR